MPRLSRVTELAKEVRSVAVELRTAIQASPDDLWKAQSGQFYLSRYPDAVTRLAPVVDSLVAASPSLLSREGVGRSVVYDIVVPIVTGSYFARFEADGTFANDLVEAGLEARIEKELESIAFADWGASWMETLCVGLWTTVGFEFGGARFVPIGDEIDQLAPALPERVRMEARTRVSLQCPGDSERRPRYLQERVNEVLRILAGASWPRMVRLGTWPLTFDFVADVPATVGTGYDPTVQLYRTHERQSFDSYMMKNWGMRSLKLPDALTDLWGEAGVSVLSSTVEQPSKAVELHQRLIACLYWLGEALRPDSDSARLVRVVTASEALLGKESIGGRSRNLGQALRLMPPLLGPLDRSRRSEVASVITRAFRGRNEVLHHGRLVRAPLVDEFGGLVWQSARAFLKLPPEVVDQPGLSAWVLQLRPPRATTD